MKTLYIAYAFLLSMLLSGGAFAQAADCTEGNASATNIKVKVDGKSVSKLNGNTKQGAYVELTFTVPSGKTPTRFSLVTYTAPAATFDYKTADQQEVYDFETGVYPAGTHTLEVMIPDGYYQIDFVKGCVIEQFGPANSNNFYGKQNRLIDYDGGGSKSNGKTKKTSICHIPPGNPENAHTISVAEKAAKKHIDQHGDYYGTCTNELDDCVVGNGEATNIKYKINGDVYSTLNGNTKPKARIKVTFTIEKGKTPTRFSLVAYTAPAATFSYASADKQQVYDMETGLFQPGTYTLEVVLPPCYYQVDFVKGCVIEKFGPENSDNFYGRQNRLISYDNGGTKSCGQEKKVTICHIPPGNPENAHTITIAEDAVDRHIQNHGDYLGECQTDTACDTCGGGLPFPVKMIYFEGQKISASQVKLKWATASEENNDYFAIEKSTDVMTWEEVCRVPGAPGGNSQEKREYSCVDNRANSGGQNLVYYRPKQVDFNGTYEYHNTIKIRISDAAFKTSFENVYPNPTTDTRVHIPYSASDNEVFNLRVLTMDGKVLLTNRFVSQAGSQVVDLDLPETYLRSGFYILEIASTDQVFRQKVYKQ